MQDSGADWNLMAVDQVIASVPTNQNFAVIDDMMVPLGYLQTWRSKLAGVVQPKSAFSAGFTPWTSGNVYYSFDPSISALNQKIFLDCAAEWAVYANVHFIARSTQANFIYVSNNPTLNGGTSFVGMVGGSQLFQVGPSGWSHGVVCHELGHALGMVHEHQRSNRDSFVTIVTNNILPQNLGDFALLTSSQNQGSYDFLSVMHYFKNSFAVNSASNTIVPLPAYSQYLNIMGNHNDLVLSTADRAGMAAVYGAGPGGTNLVTNTQDGGLGSLRAALYYAFDNPGTTIRFSIPTSDPGFSNNVYNILPTDALPTLVNGAPIDGTTQTNNPNPNGPKILLNGALARPPAVYSSGLTFKGTNCPVRGLTINNFNQFGILITGTGASNNAVTGCYVGVDQTGTVAVTNGILPIQLEAGAKANTIGGSTVAARNIIGGSIYQGLVMRDAGTSFNVVKGNYIGVNAAGTAPLANAFSGIEIYGSAASNSIGGVNVGEGNVISGNGNYGIAFSATGVNGNTILGNYIGLNAAGTAALPNAYAGVGIYGGAAANTVGGFSAGARNVISGNGNDGVLITGTTSTGNTVVGNYIGLNAAGAAAIGNAWVGVDVQGGTSGNVIASNVISGNLQNGVYLVSSFNSIWGNTIGLNAAGTTAFGNSYAGIGIVSGSQSNVIGGVTRSARNVISGNKNQGIYMGGSPVSKNLIQGNYIGLNAAGTAAVSNSWSGIELSGGPSANTIGGAGGARNFISGNGNYGISINNSANGNIIQGNTIGLNGTNGATVPNFYDNIICFSSASSNTIGGVTPGSANIIASSKSYYGVRINDAGCTNDTIRGNSIFSNNFGGISLNGSGNNLLAAPTLSSAVVTTNTTVAGTYNGANGQVFQLDFYSDATPASTAQAQTYLGAISVVGTGSAAAFTAKLGALLPTGRAVTASTTDAFGNTSALSTGVAATMTSTPNDGIPNAWRAFWFGGSGTTTNSQSASFADPDGDKLTNLQEFLAGTNPTNAASVFKLTAQNPSATTNAVAINSASGIVYRIFARDDLTAGNWDILADQVIGNGTNVFLADPAAATSAKRFYRAQVLW